MASEAFGASTLSGRYAGALFELADEGRQLDRVAEDLSALERMIEASDDLRRLINSPLVSRAGQGQAIAALVARAQISDLTRRFVGVVARNRRLFALPAMARAFSGLLARRRGEVRAEVLAARPLDDKRKDAVGEALRRALGRKVAMEIKVDPGLIAGLRVKVGSRLIDFSLDGKLKRLALAMKGVE